MSAIGYGCVSPWSWAGTVATVFYGVEGLVTKPTTNYGWYAGEYEVGLALAHAAKAAAARAVARAELRLAGWREEPAPRRLAPVPRPRPARRPSYAVRHRSRQVRLYL